MSEYNSSYSSYHQGDNLIKLETILSFFGRNKKIISPVTIIILFLSIFYAFIAKKTWEGQFQIVLATDQNSEFSDLLETNEKILQIGGVQTDNKLDTEVTILESPLVLMPIFEFVKKNKEANGKNVKNFTFQDWKKNNLVIGLKRGTSVLNISYFDKDKNLVLPVVNKISKAYQNYSQRSRKIYIDQGVNYLKNQTKFFKEKSLYSLRKAQSFAIEQNLTSLTNDTDEDILNNFGLEKIRIEAANQIRLIDERLKLFSNNFDKEYMGRYKWTAVPEMEETPLYKEIYKIDIQLDKYKTKFKPNDVLIIRLEKERENLLDMLTKQTINFLSADREKFLAIMKSAERPKGILVKYKELVRESLLDKQILMDLEKQKQKLLLQQAKEEKPWELITKPTILDKPVAPQKKGIALLGLIGGLFISSSIAFVKEKRSNFIYDNDLIKSLLPFKFLFTLKSNDFSKWDTYITFLSKNRIKEQNTNFLEIVLLGSFPNNLNEKLLKIFKNKLPNTKVNFVQNLINTSESSKKVVLVSSGMIRKIEIENFIEEVNLNQTLVEGYIIIS